MGTDEMLTPRLFENKVFSGYYAGVDAITTTFPIALVQGRDTHATHRLVDWYRDIHLGGSQDYKVKPMSRLGFHGAGIESFFTGINENRRLVTMTGPGSVHWFRRVPPYSVNCSRIDFQVTLQGVESIDEVIGLMTRDALQYRQEGRGRPYKVTRIVGHGEGDTLALGSRQSEMYIRVYNKWKESRENEDHKGELRVEVELKGGAAQRAYVNASVAPLLSLHSASVVSACAGARGIALELAGIEEVERPTSAQVQPSDVDTKLSWLRQQVAPSVKYLVQRVSVDDVLEALGIGE